jgi:hypothetical protein
MSTLSAEVKLNGVRRIHRRGVGYIYRAEISLEDLFQGIRRSTLRYAPRYQRGFKKWGEKDDADLDQLLPIGHPELQLSVERARAMAVKYLLGHLYTAHVTWNARKEAGFNEPDFDDEQETLGIETVITVPDTGHRHLAYYLLGLWKTNPEEIPSQVDVDGTPVSREEIAEKLKDFNLSDESVFCDVYTLTAKEEGFLYDEFNSDSKPPARAVAIDLNPDKTPGRRFVYGLIDRCKIFSREEVETRGNTIGSKSRKLTTNSTLEGAVKAFEKRIQRLENTDKWDDLLDFTCSFFQEWAKCYSEFLPGASAEARHELRDDSFALSNIMFHPLFRIIFELWEDYEKRGVDWRTDSRWKDAVAKITGETTVRDEDTDQPWTGSVMDRANPSWRGKVLVRRFDQEGNMVAWSVSSTRQTRDAAYYYLLDVAGLKTLTAERTAALVG